MAGTERQAQAGADIEDNIGISEELELDVEFFVATLKMAYEFECLWLKNQKNN
jgi:hypothetical protein